MKTVKVYIISGFLGAGKTTLIRKLLKDAFSDEKVVILENEFGQVNIDAQLLQGSGIAVKEISAGCICCSLSMAFGEALYTILETYQPDCILIEPTGVAKISSVIQAVSRTKLDNLELQGVATVVCGETCLDYIEGYGNFFEEQIQKASVVLVNQLETLSPEERQTVVSSVKGLNSDGFVVTEPWDEVDAQEIVAMMEQSAPKDEISVHLRMPARGRRREKSPFSSWTWETDSLLTKEGLEYFCAQLQTGQYGKILRGKGIVPQVQGWLHFDYTPKATNIINHPSAPKGTICVIGQRLNEEKLQQLLEELEAK